MRQYYFDSRFSADILAGKKSMTVRRVWKKPVRKGETLCLHIDLPKKNSTIVVSALCSEVCPIRVSTDSIIIRTRKLSSWEIRDFVRKDGFRSFADMIAFFERRYSLPFTEQRICWNPVPNSEGSVSP